jgi:hypothetical protein
VLRLINLSLDIVVKFLLIKNQCSNNIAGSIHLIIIRQRLLPPGGGMTAANKASTMCRRHGSSGGKERDPFR